jgi:hypothetical protein
MPEVVLGDVALWRRFYLAAKPSHVGGGRCGWGSLPSASSYGLQSSVKGTELSVRHLSGAALSHHAAVGSGAFLGGGGVKPLGLDIWWSVDRLGTCVTESYME